VVQADRVLCTTGHLLFCNYAAEQQLNNVHNAVQMAAHYVSARKMHHAFLKTLCSTRLLSKDSIVLSVL
jgi:hypothetical protein